MKPNAKSLTERVTGGLYSLYLGSAFPLDWSRQPDGSVTRKWRLVREYTALRGNQASHHQRYVEVPIYEVGARSGYERA